MPALTTRHPKPALTGAWSRHRASAKLGWREVALIRRDVARERGSARAGVIYRRLASVYGVSESTIRQIASGDSWPAAQMPVEFKRWCATAVSVLVLALLAVSASAQPVNRCDTPPAAYEPCLGVPVVLWMCGPVAIPSDPSARVEWDMAIDGQDQPSPGLLMAYPPEPTASGMVPYISPGALVTLRTPGPHTITVTYGPNKTRMSVVWYGVTIAKSPIGLPDSACPSTARESR